MTFEVFSMIVRDWRERFTPAEASKMVANLWGMGVVETPGVTLEAALALVAKGEQPAPAPRQVRRSPTRATASTRARALLRAELRDGPRLGAAIEAAAVAADIPRRALLAAADALKVRTQRGQWWLPG